MLVCFVLFYFVVRLLRKSYKVNDSGVQGGQKRWILTTLK